MDDYHLTDKQIKEGIKICYDHIQSLLNHCEIIFKENPDSSIGLGLYTFAIEEIGKLLLLQDVLLTTLNSDGTFNVRKEIFGIGGGAHTNIKFQKILPLLPEKCKKIGGIIGAITDSNPSSFVGIFRYTEPDFGMRKEFFYVDWDDASKNWKTPLKRDRAHILTAMNEVKKWISQNINI